MPKFKKGDKVRQIMPAPFEGEVESFTVDQETGEVQLHIVNGVHATYFKEHELESVPGEGA